MVSQNFFHTLFEKVWPPAILLLIVLIVGGGATGWTVWRKDYEMREHLLGQTRRIVQTVNPKDIQALSGTDADLDSPRYQRLKDLLTTLRQADDRCRFIYLMGRQADGTVFVFVDSEDPSSKDYSPPGQIYGEAGTIEAGVFETGESIVFGPTEDRWGVWISAYVPIHDFRTDTAVAFLGMDIDARVWNRNLARAAVMPIALTSVLAAILIIASVLASRRCRWAAAPPWLHYLEATVVLMAGLIATLFAAQTAYKIESFNRARVFEYLAESKTHHVAAVFLDLQHAELEGFARFYECSDDITEDEFTRFTIPLVANSAVHAWGWIPAVPATEKEAFEQMVRGEGLKKFEIWGLSERGPRISAEGREMYFPVFRIARRDGNLDALGFDVGSEPVRRSALTQAIRSRMCTATPPLSLVEGSDDQKAMILFRPVFEPDNEDRLRGFVVAVIRLDTLLASVHETASVHLSIALMKKPGGLQLLARSCDSSHSSFSTAHTVSRPVTVHGQVLTVIAHPGPTFLRRYPLHRAVWIYVVAGVLLTSLTIVLVARPVQQRKRLEELVLQRTAAVREIEARYNQVAEQSRTFTWEIDAEGLYTYVSPSVKTILGYRPEELTGQKHYFDLWPETDRHKIGKKAHDIEKEKRRFRDFENQVVCRDGSILWMSTNGIPILDADGALRGYRGTDTDITERKQFEAERERLLSESETGRAALLSTLEDRKRAESELARLVSAVEQVNETVVITDSDGTICYANPTFTRLTGYAREEALGQNPRILKSGEHGQAYYRRLWDTISGGKTWEGRLVNKRKDGTLYTEDATISPVRDETGRIVNYVAVKRDITEQLKAEQENARLEQRLQQLQRVESIGRLAGGVAHDFNNMLSVILGYGEELLERLPADDPLHENAKQIVRAGQRSATLIGQLLAFSRRQTLQPRVVDLNALLANLESMLRRLIGEHIELRITCCSDLYRVMADPGQIEHVVVNLAINAQDAMPQGGTLMIETANMFLDAYHTLVHGEIALGEYAMLSIRDTGCGMDRQTLAQIFEPFFTTKGKGRGTGLGLASAYGIVRQSGGQIVAESEPGKGSEFRIYLPRTLAERTDHPDSPRIDSIPGMGEHILVVEDEASLRTLIARELTELGYRTSTAVDGQDALRMVQQQELYPDLLLTDVIMPGINGTELATRLRREQPDLKVLFMSGYSDELIQSHGVLEPGILFLGKPFRRNDLARKVREALQSRIEPQGLKNILMIDDEPLFRDLLQHQCIKRGYEFTGVDNAAAALEALSSQEFGVLLLDRNLPGSDGRRILQEIRQAGHDLPAILLTGDLASVDLPTFQALGVIHAVEKSADNAGLLDWMKDHRL